MDKKLYIACLKENFDFLDFWDRYGQKAKQAEQTFKKHIADGGSGDPSGWPKENYKKLWGALKTSINFWRGLNSFGLRPSGRNGDIEKLFVVLDPANRDLPDALPFHSPQDEPAIQQIRIRRFEPFEAKAMCAQNTPVKPQERLIKVDLSKKKTDILNEFKQFLDRAYKLHAGKSPWSDAVIPHWQINYKEWSPDQSREREEAWNQLKIWRMRKAHKPFSEITKELKITHDVAKKAVYRAYERTQGRPYDPEKYRKFIMENSQNKEDLALMCQNCQDKKCYKTREPCPEIMRYADMEYVGRKENLEEPGISDYRQYQDWAKHEKHHI